MVEAYKNYWKGYADFKGRTDLGGYWWAVLAHFLVSFLLSFLLAAMEGLAREGGGIYLNVSPPFSTSFTLLCLSPSLAVAVRRLRDAGHAWTNLFWILLPLAGPIVLLVKLCGASSSAAPREAAGQAGANGAPAWRAYTQPQPAPLAGSSPVSGAGPHPPAGAVTAGLPARAPGSFHKLPLPALQPYTGSGICDVCGKPLSGQGAYIVPNAVFYGSPEWREHFRRTNGVMMRLTGLDTEKEIDRMQRRDRSAGSAVCKGCIHMFAE